MQENNIENVVPGISFSKKHGMIMIFRSTIQALSEADYIRFLMNMEKDCLAVQACDKKTLDCFRVPAYDPKEWTFRIYSDIMQRMLWTRCGWEDEYTYRVFLQGSFQPVRIPVHVKHMRAEHQPVNQRSYHFGFHELRRAYDGIELLICSLHLPEGRSSAAPSVRFDTALYTTVKTDKYGKFTLNAGKHTYSASPAFCADTVQLKVTSNEVIVMDICMV